MSGFTGIDDDFEVDSGDSAENINVDGRDGKLPPRWRQIEMLREKRDLSKLMSSLDDYDYDYDDSEEE